MKKTTRTLLLSALLLIALFLFCGCFPGDGSNDPGDRAGFFSGIWHGWIAPFSLVYSLFNSKISIYEVYNNGFAYNLGYYIAVISGFGGIALSRKKRRKDND